LITSPIIFNSELTEGIINNRVEAHIFHFAWYAKQNRLDLRYSFSKNYGSFSDLFDQVKIQNSVMLSWKKEFPNERMWGNLSAGCDRGELLGNHFGIGLEAGIRF
jgi:hypothetical protein